LGQNDLAEHRISERGGVTHGSEAEGE